MQITTEAKREGEIVSAIKELGKVLIDSDDLLALHKRNLETQANLEAALELLREAHGHLHTTNKYYDMGSVARDFLRNPKLKQLIGGSDE